MEEFSQKKRRPRTRRESSETAPLVEAGKQEESQQQQYYPYYSTFTTKSKAYTTASNTRLRIKQSFSSSGNNNKKKKWWNSFQTASLVFRPAWLWFLFIGIVGIYVAWDPHTTLGIPQWEWDYNYYDHPEARKGARNLLLAQISGTLALEDLSQISSLPNRAYSRQWGWDYVLYNSGTSSRRRTCFQKVEVVDFLLSHRVHQRYEYDVVAIFPPDTMVIDLDFDLNLLLPQDKLVAIAGWHRGDDHFQSHTDVVLFNLHHPEATKVVELWREAVDPRDITCGVSNDLQILLNVIKSTLGKREDIALYVTSLEESLEGYIGSAIKGLPTPVPAPKYTFLMSDIIAAKVKVQRTVDSVCYRFYPKCLVVN